MKDYAELFSEAMERSMQVGKGFSNYPLHIDSETPIEIDSLVSAIARDFEEFLPHTDVLPGKCYRVARELSYVLFDLGVRHAVTIGDVELVDGLYANTQVEEFLADMDEGYQLDFVDGVPRGKPIRGHAWITLENGCVIDATVLASQHRKSPDSQQLLSFEEAIYFTGKQGTPVVRHIPMFTGFVYYQKALIDVGDGDADTYCKWSEDYGRLMARLDLIRMVPALSHGA